MQCMCGTGGDGGHIEDPAKLQHDEVICTCGSESFPSGGGGNHTGNKLVCDVPECSGKPVLEIYSTTTMTPYWTWICRECASHYVIFSAIHDEDGTTDMVKPFAVTKQNRIPLWIAEILYEHDM